MLTYLRATVVISIFLLFSFESKAQANYMGSFVFDPYYGGPNLDRLLWDSNGGAGNTIDFQTRGYGPFGIRGEYIVADQFGVGFDVIYTTVKTQYTSIDSVYNSATDMFDEKRTDVLTNNRRLRVQLRFNYHFVVSNPKLDAYMGVSAGTNTRYRKMYEDGVEVTKLEDDYFGITTLIPVSFRLSAGMRYYFSNNLGINAELGLGGPLISAGLSVRF